MRKLNIKSEKLKKVLALASRAMLAVAALLLVAYAMVASFSDANPGIKAYAVATGSMDPVIPRGSLVIAKKADFDNLQEGDIVTFLVDVNLDGKKETVTHYFDGYVVKDGINYFATRSEVTGLRDRWLVPASDLRGVCVFSVPQFGKLSLFASHPIGLLCLAADGLILLVSIWLISVIDAAEAKVVPICVF